MEVDLRKSDCNRESPHWHLCRGGSRIGSISAYGTWVKEPDAPRDVIKEAEELTSEWYSELVNAYEHNRIDGADY